MNVSAFAAATRSGNAVGRVQPAPQLLAGLEERDLLLGDLDAVAGTRIAADPRVAPLYRKGAEPAQLDPVAARQGRRDLLKDRGDDRLDIALIKMRVGFRQLLNELGLCHRALTRLPVLERQSVPKLSRSVKAGIPVTPIRIGRRSDRRDPPADQLCGTSARNA